MVFLQNRRKSYILIFAEKILPSSTCRQENYGKYFTLSEPTRLSKIAKLDGCQNDIVYLYNCCVALREFKDGAKCICLGQCLRLKLQRNSRT